MRPADRDDTTRYLCAAAHLDDDFADDAIREFLVEPTRAVPPTPGVRAGAVLAEAVAARARRKVRDGVLLALLVLALFLFSSTALISWVVVAVVVAFIGAMAKVKADGGALGAAVERADLMRRLIPMLIVLAVGGALAYAVIQYLGGSSSSSSTDTDTDTDLAATVLAYFLVLVLAAVLVIDELVVWHHLNNRFSRGRIVPEPRPEQLNSQVRQVYGVGSGRFLARLSTLVSGPRYAAAPALAGESNESPAAPVVVARGYKMFVGAGDEHEPWSYVLPLKPSSEDGEVTRLTTELLYRRVGAELDKLRGATSLSPGRRFATLAVTEQIVVAAEELIDHVDDVAVRDFLAGPSAAPYPMLRGHRVRQLRDAPLEWARYYLCCQLETWDGDFVVSAFLHLAVDDTTLYIEWTPCVLPPIRADYRKIDSLSDSPLPSIRRALVNLVALPATVPRRLVRFCTTIKPPKRRRGMVSPDMYGVQYSLRELAADVDMHNYFQLVDRERYQKVLESRLIPAISDVMREAGYEVATLEERAAAVSNSNTYINATTVSAGVIGGRGNRAAAPPAKTAAAKAP